MDRNCSLLVLVNGEGFVCCVTRDSDQLVKLTEVLHVPDLRGNLISVRKLTSKGFNVCLAVSCVSSQKQTEHLLVLQNISDCTSLMFQTVHYRYVTASSRNASMCGIIVLVTEIQKLLKKWTNMQAPRISVSSHAVYRRHVNAA